MSLGRQLECLQGNLALPPAGGALRPLPEHGQAFIAYPGLRVGPLLCDSLFQESAAIALIHDILFYLSG